MLISFRVIFLHGMGLPTLDALPASQVTPLEATGVARIENIRLVSRLVGSFGSQLQKGPLRAWGRVACGSARRDRDSRSSYGVGRLDVRTFLDVVALGRCGSLGAC